MFSFILGFTNSFSPVFPRKEPQSAGIPCSFSSQFYFWCLQGARCSWGNRSKPVELEKCWKNLGLCVGMDPERGTGGFYVTPSQRGRDLAQGSWGNSSAFPNFWILFLWIFLIWGEERNWEGKWDPVFRKVNSFYFNWWDPRIPNGLGCYRMIQSHLGTPSTIPGFSKLCPTWPWRLPGMGIVSFLSFSCRIFLGFEGSWLSFLPVINYPRY